MSRYISQFSKQNKDDRIELMATPAPQSGDQQKDEAQNKALIPGSTWFPILPQFSNVDYGKAMSFLTNKNTISLFVVRDMMQVCDRIRLLAQIPILMQGPRASSSKNYLTLDSRLKETLKNSGKL